MKGVVSLRGKNPAGFRMDRRAGVGQKLTPNEYSEKRNMSPTMSPTIYVASCP